MKYFKKLMVEIPIAPSIALLLTIYIALTQSIEWWEVIIAFVCMTLIVGVILGLLVNLVCLVILIIPSKSKSGEN